MKRIICFLLLTVFVIVACGCNRQIFDVQYTFNYAIIQLPNGAEVEGEVESWTDYEDGDQIQVKINGVVYLVHSTDIALIDNRNEKD